MYLRHPDDLLDTWPEPAPCREEEETSPDITVTGEEFELLEALARVAFKQSSDLYAILRRASQVQGSQASSSNQVKNTADSGLLNNCGLTVANEHLAVIAEQLIFITTIRRRGRGKPTDADAPTSLDGPVARMTRSLFVGPRDAVREAKVDGTHPEFENYFAYGVVEPEFK